MSSDEADAEVAPHHCQRIEGICDVLAKAAAELHHASLVPDHILQTIRAMERHDNRVPAVSDQPGADAKEGQETSTELRDIFKRDARRKDARLDKLERRLFEVQRGLKEVLDGRKEAHRILKDIEPQAWGPDKMMATSPQGIGSPGMWAQSRFQGGGERVPSFSTASEPDGDGDRQEPSAAKSTASEERDQDARGPHIDIHAELQRPHANRWRRPRDHWWQVMPLEELHKLGHSMSQDMSFTPFMRTNSRKAWSLPSSPTQTYLPQFLPPPVVATVGSSVDDDSSSVSSREGDVDTWYRERAANIAEIGLPSTW